MASTRKQTTVGSRDAVMKLALAAALSDGRLRKVEITRLRLMTQVSPLFRNVPDVDDYIGALAEDLRRSGMERFIAGAVAALPERLKATAFAWAVEMIRADGKVLPPEHRFMAELGSALGIDGHLSGKIRQIVEIRMRPR